MTENKRKQEKNKRKTTQSRLRKPLLPPNNRLQPENYVATQGTMSLHRTKSSVATRKISVVTQTAKHAVAFLGLFCTSSSHPNAVNSILPPLYTLCKPYKFGKTFNTTLNKSKNMFLLQNLSITYTKLDIISRI